jgi:hypothetical protein
MKNTGLRVFLKKSNISKRCKISRSHHKKYTASGVFSGLCTKSTIRLMKPLFFGRCSYAWHGINPDYRSMSDETVIRILFGFTILPTTRFVLPGGFNPDYHPGIFLSFLPAPGRTFLPLPYRIKDLCNKSKWQITKGWLSFAELTWSSSKKSCISKEPSVFQGRYTYRLCSLKIGRLATVISINEDVPPIPCCLVEET